MNMNFENVGLRSDRWIRQMSKEKRMIEPFAEGEKRAGKISYGVSSYGYDFRIGNEFRILRSSDGILSDPKDSRQERFETVTADVCTIPPNSMVLAQTVEYFRIPRNVLTICFGKSTYARCGVFVNVTPFEPEWEGHATISISNTTSQPARIYANEGIGQLLFFETADICETSYADKKGKYQAQKSITHAKL